MIFEILTKGHKNISSKHKSTFEITCDENITPKGDCIIGVAMNKTLNDLSDEFKDKIARDGAKIKVILSTSNGYDEIIGEGHPNLTLNHPTDLVCRKSSYTCSRTLMINSNKAAIDLNQNLIEDLKNNREMLVKIQII
ncbi:MAG: DUF371 domain-containing protein [Methanobacteriaceae archaeon]|jgi:hypothetical protein|nr:DUF371 domain-containing protein [Methanobacteriaceae archaeon]